MQTPELLVVAGPNGSGKTSLALEYARQTGLTYVSADAIAEVLSPDNPLSVRFEAGRRFLESINEHLSSSTSPVVETTLSGRSFRRIITRAKQMGFSVSIAFLFLDSAETCIARIEERVRKGGHHVPDDEVQRRFFRSAANFWTIYRGMADNWVLLYNGTGRLQDVAAGSKTEVSIRDAMLFNDFLTIAGISHD